MANLHKTTAYSDWWCHSTNGGAASARMSWKHPNTRCSPAGASPTLVAVRVAFLVQINRLWPDFTAPVDEEDALPALRSLLGREAVLSVLGAFTHEVFQIFRAVELPWPAEFVKRKPVV